MNNKRFFVCVLFVISILAGICIGTFASGTLDKIEAYLNRGITIRYNGEVQTMYDAQGTRVYPITYKGTTYLPVRAVSNMLGIDVEWDGANNTVLLGENDYTPRTRLTDLAYYNKSNNTDGFKFRRVDTAKDNLGNEYIDPMRIMRSCQTKYWESYMLTEDYSTFSGTLFIDYEDRSSRTTCSVRVYGDGELLYSSPTMTAGVQPVDFSVDISGVDELKLEVNGKWSSSYSWLGVYIADPYLE